MGIKQCVEHRMVSSEQDEYIDLHDVIMFMMKMVIATMIVNIIIMSYSSILDFDQSLMMGLQDWIHGIWSGMADDTRGLIIAGIKWVIVRQH
jgi:hypothetical protein